MSPLIVPTGIAGPTKLISVVPTPPSASPSWCRGTPNAAPARRGSNLRWCDTALEEDGSIGPIRIYVAEPVTLKTRLRGFALRRDRDGILAAAADNDFHCTAESGDSLACTGRQGMVSIHFFNGLSFKIVQIWPSQATRGPGRPFPTRRGKRWPTGSVFITIMAMTQKTADWR